MIRRCIGFMVRKCFPRAYYDYSYFSIYRRIARQIGDRSADRKKLFQELVESGLHKSCLQIGVRDAKYGSHWVSVDLYDKAAYIDYNYDIHDLKFNDKTFDIVVCNAILEHVEDPAKAIKELYRVLKKDGLIWIETAFNQPYHPHPNDYWRVTPTGLGLWMKDFTAIMIGFFKINQSPIYTGVFFYGRKEL